VDFNQHLKASLAVIRPHVTLVANFTYILVKIDVAQLMGSLCLEESEESKLTGQAMLMLTLRLVLMVISGTIATLGPQ
jgi:hypothetical protein